MSASSNVLRRRVTPTVVVHLLLLFCSVLAATAAAIVRDGPMRGGLFITSSCGTSYKGGLWIALPFVSGFLIAVLFLLVVPALTGMEVRGLRLTACSILSLSISFFFAIDLTIWGPLLAESPVLRGVAFSYLRDWGVGVHILVGSAISYTGLSLSWRLCRCDRSHRIDPLALTEN